MWEYAQYAYIFPVLISGVKHKPVYRKPKEVHKVIHHCEQILLVLFRQSMTVNKIYDQVMKSKMQTGLSSYKRDFLDALQHLQNGELIEESTIPKYKQKLIQELTPLGRSLTELLLNLNEYMRAYSLLVQAIKDIFNISDPDCDDAIRGKLRAAGWTGREIKYGYKRYLTDSRQIAYEFNRMFIEGLTWRYGLISSQYNRNETAKIISNEIVINEIGRQFLFKFEYIDALPVFLSGPLEPSAVSNFVTCITNVLIVEKPHRLLAKQVIDVIKSLYLVLKPPKFLIETQPESLKKMLLEQEEHERQDNNPARPSWVENNREWVENAIDVYQELQRLA